VGCKGTQKKAILQMIYLDETVDVLNERENKSEIRTIEIVDSCFHDYASSYRRDAKEMTEDLLNT
jgi:hypothetical protein